MKLIVTQPLLIDPVEVWRRNRSTECAGRTKARVVCHDQQDVWSPRWGCHRSREVWFRFAGLASNHAFEWRRRRWENLRAGRMRRRALGECTSREADAATDQCRDCDGFKQALPAT